MHEEQARRPPLLQVARHGRSGPRRPECACWHRVDRRGDSRCRPGGWSDPSNPRPGRPATTPPRRRSSRCAGVPRPAPGQPAEESPATLDSPSPHVPEATRPPPAGPDGGERARRSTTGAGLPPPPATPFPAWDTRSARRGTSPRSARDREATIRDLPDQRQHDRESHWPPENVRRGCPGLAATDGSPPPTKSRRDRPRKARPWLATADRAAGRRGVRPLPQGGGRRGAARRTTVPRSRAPAQPADLPRHQGERGPRPGTCPRRGNRPPARPAHQPTVHARRFFARYESRSGAPDTRREVVGSNTTSRKSDRSDTDGDLPPYDHGLVAAPASQPMPAFGTMGLL